MTQVVIESKFPVSKTHANFIYTIPQFFDAPFKRIFDVDVEGKTESGIDLFQRAGNEPLILDFPTVIEDGFLDIRLINGGPNNPKISAIEIAPPVIVGPTVSPAPAVTPSPVSTGTVEDVLINCGGGAHTDGDGREWQADNLFVGGKPYSNTNDILNTTEDAVRILQSLLLSRFSPCVLLSLTIFCLYRNVLLHNLALSI